MSTNYQIMNTETSYYGVRFINFDLTHWFDTEKEQVEFAKKCGFEHVLCECAK